MSNKQTAERRLRRQSIRGVDYAVHEWGNAANPLLIHLHGFADTGSTFQFVADRLAENWFVVAPDWRGFGKTQRRAAAYWFPDYLADLDALLQIYSPDNAVRLVGHSMGANIGSLYAGSLPQRVAAFVNVEGFGLPDSDPAQAPDRYRAWLDASRQPQAYSSYAGFSELAHRIQRRNSRMSAEAAHFVAHEWGDAASDGTVVLRADPAHKLPNAVLYRRAEAEACWARIQAPVLLVAGKDSAFATQFGDLGDLPIPHTGIARIADCGHMIHFEQPDKLALVIHDFFSQTL